MINYATGKYKPALWEIIVEYIATVGICWLYCTVFYLSLWLGKSEINPEDFK